MPQNVAAGRHRQTLYFAAARAGDPAECRTLLASLAAALQGSDGVLQRTAVRRPADNRAVRLVQLAHPPLLVAILLDEAKAEA